MRHQKTQTKVSAHDPVSEKGLALTLLWGPIPYEARLDYFVLWCDTPDLSSTVMYCIGCIFYLKIQYGFIIQNNIFVLLCMFPYSLITSCVLDDPCFRNPALSRLMHNESFTLSDKICCTDLSRHSFCYILNYILCYDLLLGCLLFTHRQLTCILHLICRFIGNSNPAACQNAR